MHYVYTSECMSFLSPRDGPWGHQWFPGKYLSLHACLIQPSCCSHLATTQQVLKMPNTHHIPWKLLFWCSTFSSHCYVASVRSSLSPNRHVERAFWVDVCRLDPLFFWSLPWWHYTVFLWYPTVHVVAMPVTWEWLFPILWRQQLQQTCSMVLIVTLLILNLNKLNLIKEKQSKFIEYFTLHEEHIVFCSPYFTDCVLRYDSVCRQKSDLAIFYVAKIFNPLA